MKPIALSIKPFVLVARVLLPMSQTVPAGARQVNLLAIGDRGDDTRAEVSVAEGMASFAEKRLPRLDGVLTRGDNFYVTLPGGVDDPNWDRLFERMFAPATASAAARAAAEGVQK